VIRDFPPPISLGSFVVPASESPKRRRRTFRPDSRISFHTFADVKQQRARCVLYIIIIRTGGRARVGIQQRRMQSRRAIPKISSDSECGWCAHAASFDGRLFLGRTRLFLLNKLIHHSRGADGRCAPTSFARVLTCGG
jgi:hypothetical protein